MRLNSVKNIEQCKKGLYAKQLEQYANLCSIYEQLAKSRPFETSESAQTRFGSILSLASQSCLSPEKLELFRRRMHRYMDFEHNSTPIYTKQELELIEQFAYHSELLTAYKKGLDILGSACRTNYVDGSKFVDKKSVISYHKHMHNLKETEKYDTLVDLASYTMNGHNSYRTTKNAVQTIIKIDKSHISIPDFESSVRPAAFGANISGFYLGKNIPSQIRQVSNEGHASLFDYSRDEKEELTLGRTVKESAIGIGNHIRRFTTHNKKQVTALALALTLFGYLGAHKQVSEHMDGRNHHFGNLASVDVLKNQSTVSNETKLQLISIGDTINTLRFFTKDPTPEQLEQVKNDLDSAIDMVMSDLVSQAFEEKFPEYTVSNVETKYDRTTAETDGEQCIITFVDKEGREHTATVDNFSSNIYKSPFAPEILEPNPLGKSFDDEYVLDSTVTENIEYISNFPDSSSTKTKETLNTLSGIYTTLLQLANGELVLVDSFFNGLELEYNMPESINVTTNNEPITTTNAPEQTPQNEHNLDDDGR